MKLTSLQMQLSFAGRPFSVRGMYQVMFDFGSCDTTYFACLMASFTSSLTLLFFWLAAVPAARSNEAEEVDPVSLLRTFVDLTLAQLSKLLTTSNLILKTRWTLHNRDGNYFQQGSNFLWAVPCGEERRVCFSKRG